MPELVAHEVSFARAGTPILDRVSVVARPGETLALVGPSGSGKSSLLALLAGLEQPDSGVVRRGHARVDGVGDDVGIVLQGYGLVGLLTAAENVEVPLQARGLARTEVRARAAAALEAVELGASADHLVEELSGGQQQRVAVARALAISPAVLIADEVTAELDRDTRDLVAARVLACARHGATVVIATHDPDLAARCDRVVQLVDGRVVPDPPRSGRS